MYRILKQQVKKILIEYPETRNSDIALTIKIWQVFYNVGLSVSVMDLYELPREDNVKRIRAKFCQQKFDWAFPTEAKIAKSRKIKADKWQNALGYIKREFREVRILGHNGEVEKTIMLPRV